MDAIEKRALELMDAECIVDAGSDGKAGMEAKIVHRAAIRAIVAALTPPKIAGGNLIDDPLYRGLDALYDRAWTDCHQRRKFDPRGCREWESLANLVRSALTPPEGYVLVPVELPVEMEIAFMEAWVSKRRCIDDPEMQDAWEAALAARPEVKP